MKKYIVKQYSLKDRALAVELMNEIRRAIDEPKYIFEFANVSNINGIKKKCETIDLEKYRFIYEHEHIEENDPSRKVQFISNLNDAWIKANPNRVEAINQRQFDTLCNLFLKRSNDYATLMLGVDEIIWDKSIKSSVCEGTYGYDKAESYSKGGYNYWRLYL